MKPAKTAYLKTETKLFRTVFVRLNNSIIKKVKNMKLLLFSNKIF